MARGLPDYYRGMDAAFEASPQMIVRPKYGGAIQQSGNQWCTANAVTLLTSISGRGMIYGGTVWLDHTASQQNAEIMMKLDGGFIFSLSFLRMLQYGILVPGASIITLNIYDSVNFVYSAGLSYGITFEKSLDLGYNETQGEDLTVHFNLVYALL